MSPILWWCWRAPEREQVTPWWFGLHGGTYRTDRETYRAVRSLIPMVSEITADGHSAEVTAATTGDTTAAIAAVAHGLATGRIVHVDGPTVQTTTKTP